MHAICCIGPFTQVCLLARDSITLRRSIYDRHAGQRLGAEIAHLVEMVHERHRDAAHSGKGVVSEFLRIFVRRADEREAADTADRLQR